MLIKRNLFLHIFLFSIILFSAIYFSYYWIWLFFAIETIFILYKFGTTIFPFLAIMIIPIFFPLMFNFSIEQQNKEIYFGKVEKIYETSMVISIENNNYYIMLEEQETINFVPGDKVSFSCNENEFLTTEVNDSFSTFLKSNKTEYYCYANNLKLQEEHINSYRNILYSKVINSETEYAKFAQLMIYGYVSEHNSELYNTINTLGINPLFIISGMQISLLIILFNKLLSKIIKNEKIAFIISSLISLWFIYLIFFPPPALRAWICSNLNYFLIKQPKRKGRVNIFTNNDVLFIVAIIFFFWNPFLFFNLGIVLSFSITYFVNLLSQKNESKIKIGVTISIVSFVISFPIIASFNESLNLMAPFFNLILNPIISILYFLVIFTLPFSILWNLLTPIFILMQTIFDFLINFVYVISVTNIFIAWWILVVFFTDFAISKNVEWKRIIIFSIVNLLMFYCLMLL